ncbi:molybdopterin molybdotransferase MoeA [Leeia sp. TBRC 13508]|uniref:Molybdopterin molybdenumtransferase n=1 Tax=Leeia speluncae TaxID=2884804 RepID=A0ABS8D8Q2_9NEIS|nr:gephyrin-like molybdotransferase Glp [Leeia speluncae]MCB6184584.1 molybdopterin molybdotransferase MoeA [Leeia speluncae]
MKPAELLSVDDALALLLQNAKPARPTETIDTLYADGRVLAADVVSPIAVPGFDNSAMDGYGLHLSSIPEAPFSLPVVQRIAAGQTGAPLAENTAARIFTGAPIPTGCNIVVMQEDTEVDGENIRILRTPKAGQNIRLTGEDIAPNAVVVTKGTKLTPVELSLIASVGVAEVSVYKPLRVATLFTGDELTMPGEPLPPGGIYNSNRFAITALLRRLGCVVTDLGNVPDNLEATKAALADAAAEHDVVITSGGVSVGEEDHVKAAVSALGELSLWKIAMKPGKPLAFGKIGTTSFVGLPGNPVSSYITLGILVRPYLLSLMGATTKGIVSLPLVANFTWKKADKRREFLRAQVDSEGKLSLFGNQGSGVMTSLAWADGVIDLPPNTQVSPGDVVRFIPLNTLLDA